MNKLFEKANEYLQESDWKDLALVKFCLCAIGVMLGLCVKPKHKKAVAGGAALVFLATYVPLMTKFFRILLRRDED